MKRYFFLFCFLFPVSVLSVSCSFHFADLHSTETVKVEFQSIFRNTRVIEVKPSEIPGVYEIYLKGNPCNLIYYHPEKKLLIFGELWTVNGTSITGEKVKRCSESLQMKESEHRFNSTFSQGGME